MKLNIYQVDAFTEKVFSGNPAAVIPLKQWLPDETMQAIGNENNLSETAFFVPNGDVFELRWFTPTTEVQLCGHATLATAHVLFEHLGYEPSFIQFSTKSGILKVSKSADQYVMDFPADEPQIIAPHHLIQRGLPDVNLLEYYKGKDDYLVIVRDEATVRDLIPDFKILSQLDSRGILVTAKGEEVDFVSRCFFPQSGIDEDPVTGSAHTLLTLYWTKQLGNKSLIAKQLSTRGGNLICQQKNDRVILKGHAVTYMVGEILSGY